MAHGHRGNKLKKLPSVPNFVVCAFLCPFGGALQAFGDIVLARFFKILAARKSILPKTLTVVVSECVLIGNDPCFHCLNHEVDHLAVDAVEVVPPVAFHQMIGGLYVNRSFRVH